MPPGQQKGPADSVAAAAAPVTNADLQPNAPSEYTVVKGDTLWGIAGRFLKDPWKWPQIWNMNREQIKDPHWIYPGDVIRLDRSGASPQLSLESGAAGNVVKLEPRVRVEPLRRPIPSIPTSAIAPFLTRPLVVEPGTLDNAPLLLATQESRVIIGAGDTAYADRIGPSDGLNWQVFRPGTAMRDPETGELLGYEAKYVGDARVRRYGNPTTLEITKAREEINRGDRLLPAREAAFPNFVPHAPGKPIHGVIMSVNGGVSELGQYQIVAINRGARDGLEVGDVLATFHRGAVVGEHAGTRDYFDASWFRGMEVKPVPIVPDAPVAGADRKVGAVLTGQVKLPDERNGLVFVFRVFDKLSYALVMRATQPIYVGDVVGTP